MPESALNERVFKVTREHLTKGIRGNPTKDAVAVCLRETLKTDKKIWVTSDSIMIGRHVYTTPALVRAHLTMHDRSQPSEPFEFRLNEH